MWSIFYRLPWIFLLSRTCSAWNGCCTCSSVSGNHSALRRRRVAGTGSPSIFFQIPAQILSSSDATLPNPIPHQKPQGYGVCKIQGTERGHAAFASTSFSTSTNAVAQPTLLSLAKPRLGSTVRLWALWSKHHTSSIELARVVALVQISRASRNPSSPDVSSHCVPSSLNPSRLYRTYHPITAGSQDSKDSDFAVGDTAENR